MEVIESQQDDKTAPAPSPSPPPPSPPQGPVTGEPTYHIGEKVPPETRAKLRLTVALNNVIAVARNPANPRPISLGLIVETAEERAFGVLMAFLCIPFLLPVAIPGTSTPFGIAIMLLGFQIIIRRHKPWLPARILNWKLPDKFTGMVINGMAKLFTPLERVIRPRWLFMQNTGSMIVVGAMLILDGFYLAMPFGNIPLTNTIPAWLALIKILGITEKDGVSLLVGTLLTLAITVGLVLLMIFSWNTLMAYIK
jgi:hypothetical protein